MDMDRVLKLLQIMDLAKNWPQFQGLHDVARAELTSTNGEAVTELAQRVEEAKAKQEAENAKRAAIAERQAAQDAAKAPVEESEARR